MKLGIFDAVTSGGGTLDELVTSASSAREHGFDSWWLPQIFSFEALAVHAVVGREVPDIALGTAVVPTWPRHPATMAQLALTAQAAAGGDRLTLGIGLSHQMVVENMFGMSFAHPARHMSEYLDALVPLLEGREAAVSGESVSAHLGLQLPELPAPEVIVAALGPRMLRIAGTKSHGTVTWMTGPNTLESHIVPTIRAAAAEAGRPEPRVVAALPVQVTDDVDTTRQRVAEVFAIYGVLPSYRAMLDREGAEGPADVAILGTEDEVAERIRSLAGIGVTEFIAVEFNRPGSTAHGRTRDLLRSLVGTL